MLLGIGSTMRVGKDTAANALCRDLGYRRVGFADKVKELALKVDPLVQTGSRAVNVNIGHGRLKHAVVGLGWERAKDEIAEIRVFLQRLGTGAREVFGDDFWVEHALRGVRPGDRVVFPDVRFQNEAEAIRAAGGKVIQIVRPGFEAKGHISETALLNFEFDDVVQNTGSIADLERAVVELVRGWLNEQHVGVQTSLGSSNG